MERIGDKISLFNDPFCVHHYQQTIVIIMHALHDQKCVFWCCGLFVAHICIRYVLLDHASYWKKSLEANIRKEIIFEFKNENDNDF